MRLLFLCLLFAASLLPVQKAAADPADVAEIEALYATWRDAVRGSDINGYLGILHPEIRLLPPGAPAINGLGAYEAFLGPVFANATYEIEIERIQEIDVVGDMATAEYDYTIVLTLKNPDVGIDQPGALTNTRTSARYFDVLRRTDAGEWRVWRHSWQNN